ncbi:electron transport complex subunit RnfG [Sideroxyarcus emersonii]|uniref:Ion-translocating oxidoreductase complex subunit G n=1 Tax=Sideroxyarcus emersonii TaxID=2764705 RepID=A0AAN1X8U4_9PROT|nr:electron transport complex subunit RsxG [Sideroxyarcus emersonii]BCK87041.1 electron transport complex subunit RnfG [Sideroxyarcus emersonii]
MKLEKLRGKLFYQGVLLGSVALLTSAALAYAAHLTEADIKAAEAADLKQSLTQVLPGEYENDLLKDTVTLSGQGGDVLVYRARRQGKVEAVVYRMIGHGYAGALVCVMGVSREGRILGVRVISHKETPGLGDKIEPAKSNWIHAFEGKWLGEPPADKWGVKKDGGVFDQFAGATITPRGVVRAVKEGLEFFEQNRSVLLDESAPAGDKS